MAVLRSGRPAVQHTEQRPGWNNALRKLCTNLYELTFSIFSKGQVTQNFVGIWKYYGMVIFEYHLNFLHITQK